MKSFRDSLQQLINFHSLENNSDTPDGILADYLERCLGNFDATLQAREQWYGRPIHQKSVVVTDDVPVAHHQQEQERGR